MSTSFKDIIGKFKAFSETRKGKITLSVAGCAVVALIITGVVAGSIPRNNAAAAGTSSREDTTPVFSDVSSASSEDVSASSTDSVASAASSTPTSAAPASSAAPTTPAVDQVAVAVTDISITKSSITVAQGATYRLTAVVTPGNASDKTLNWTSTDTSIATVDGNGVVTGKSAGTATIHASGANGHKGTCKVTVKASNNDAPAASVPSSSTPSQTGGGDDVPEGYHGTHTSGEAPLVWNNVPDEIHPEIMQELDFQDVGAKHNGVRVVGIVTGELNTTPELINKYAGQTVTFSFSTGKSYDINLARGVNGFTFPASPGAGHYTVAMIAKDGTKLAQVSFTIDQNGSPIR